MASWISTRRCAIPPIRARLLPVYDADGVHLTDAGYQAMANAVNLSMLF